MNIVPSPAEVQPSPRNNPEAGVYSTKPRRPGDEIDVVDAEVVSEDAQPRTLRLHVPLPEDFDLHAIVGTAVATVALGFALLLVALAAALVLTEMFVLMINEPL
jgi:hypothetical protein